jgi:prevent-host-death family protein
MFIYYSENTGENIMAPETLPETFVVTSLAARNHWRTVLDNAVKGNITTIARHGQEVAVLLPADDYELIKDRLFEKHLILRANLALDAWKDHPEAGVLLDELD